MVSTPRTNSTGVSADGALRRGGTTGEEPRTGHRQWDRFAAVAARLGDSGRTVTCRLAGPTAEAV
ncbi:hypothetical protein FXN61_07495 [Lentzea sp. PSKA42]|uniref:Uncharacterized protein n=1 Tax=Lentzea indica TaxID=2604800 RepID=A0ABX1FDG7_9PSEU|nr:hypothetical protein [Lentzea indica]NKE56683.1 hypothetical protein [Lentzea indica]